ncbi:hypothetical protein SLS57_012503 [Botryosphaeria dothidea]
MSLTQIAELISAKSKELDQRGVVDPDSQLGFRNMTAKDYASRGILIQAIRDLEKLALGPLDALNILVSNPLDVASTHAIARYNIAHHVPDAGTTIPALASALPFADEEYLARVLRHAIANGLFQEPQPGLITHTRLSRLLRDDPDALAMVQFVTEDLWPVPLRMCDALDRWPRSRDTAHTAWALATGVEGSPFEYFADRPATVARGGTRVVVCDNIMPEMASTRYEEKGPRNLDLNMMMSAHGKERTASEWTKLFADADARFKVEFEQWEYSVHGLVKATWKP